jgi:hypothetical protein
MRRYTLLGTVFLGSLLWGCAPDPGGDVPTDGTGGSDSPATGGSGGSKPAPTATGGSQGSGGSTSPGSGGSSTGSGGSSSGGASGSGGSVSGSGGAGGSKPDAAPAGDTGAPAGGDAGPGTDPVPAGAFPGCANCKSIFDGKTLDGWSQSPAGSFVVKEGAIASTGKGAHAWTKDDYGEFRIIFSVRQISGDHKPCTTLFTTRPTGAPTRGLSGIQFQPPLGGSWDYRPGKNSGPDKVHWIYPNPRPTFDVKKWHRCEILARASKGEFRAACCEIEGKTSCKGIEVLHYMDPTAGKKGPFALMMHNGGLFDEYKDFWVETDPMGDELITMK